MRTIATSDDRPASRGQRMFNHSVHYFPRSFLIAQFVESFAASTHYVSPAAQRLRVVSDLPPPLWRIATTVQRSACTWLAWLDEQTLRFVVAALADRCARPGLAAIRLTFYDQDGRWLANGEWSVQPDGRWTLCGQ